jgi:hypothetical protein
MRGIKGQGKVGQLWMERRFEKMGDWYRNLDWNDEIETDFFARLARSKSQRDQYLMLQALYLSESHPSVSLRLVDLYFDTRTDDFHDDRARRAAAAAHFALGGHVAALDAYLETLDGDDSSERNLHVSSPIEFAFLAARFRSKGHYKAALIQLSSIAIPAPSQLDSRFRYFAANALLLAEIGSDPASAYRQATSVLDMPEALLASYPDLVWRLRGITRS